MAETVQDLIEWLQTLEPDAQVGVDAGGLCLRVVNDPEPYYEIGGLPEEDEDA